MTARARRSEAKADRPMVTVHDPSGEPFETGDPGTLNSLLCAGYSLPKGTSREEAMNSITPAPTDTATE